MRRSPRARGPLRRPLPPAWRSIPRAVMASDGVTRERRQPGGLAREQHDSAQIPAECYQQSPLESRHHAVLTLTPPWTDSHPHAERRPAERPTDKHDTSGDYPRTDFQDDTGQLHHTVRATPSSACGKMVRSMRACGCGLPAGPRQSRGQQIVRAFRGRLERRPLWRKPAATLAKPVRRRTASSTEPVGWRRGRRRRRRFRCAYGGRPGRPRPRVETGSLDRPAILPVADRAATAGRHCSG
ncbi:putative secreted protein [Candidatus Protofrankia californiensis]|uniref:Putative secreted protein n=1 Tax=Candidatus Protofrankia californiensis TaxID=1839754 RepID=A0A1C3P3M2_9ACTN|nr:putative secreted protein [Candidatus Protofrankia californiensis]